MSIIHCQLSIRKGVCMGRRKKVCKENIIDELVAIGFAKATDYLFIQGDRLCVRETGALTGRQASAICQIEKTSAGIRVKFYDKMKALELLGRELGMFGGDAPPEDSSGGLMEAVLRATGEELDTDDISELQ